MKISDTIRQLTAETGIPAAILTVLHGHLPQVCDDQTAAITIEPNLAPGGLCAIRIVETNGCLT